MNNNRLPQNSALTINSIKRQIDDLWREPIRTDLEEAFFLERLKKLSAELMEARRKGV